MDFFRIAEEEMVCKQTLEAGISDPDQVICMRRARLIAGHLIDENGEFDLEKGRQFKKMLNISTPTYLQTWFSLHAKHVLDLFIESPHARLRLKQLSLPLANRYIENLIGSNNDKREVSLALFIALLSPLRQSVGSCFATAPLMMVQYEQPYFLFEELYNLVTRGHLKRIIEGKEVRVPMSIKTGPGNLLHPMGPYSHLDPSLVEAIGRKGPPPIPGETVKRYISRNAENPSVAEENFKGQAQSLLLKAYEFTVASLSDWKTDFSKWNMYTSLGLDPKEEGGLGEVIFQFLEELIGKINQKIDQFQEEIMIADEQIRALELILSNTTEPDRIRRLRGEIQVKAHHLYVNQEMTSEEVQRAKKINDFYKFMNDELMRLILDYFQEVYDPEMISEEGEILQDRPAGFRLLYKYGRSEPSVWKMIYSKEEYSEKLAAFFQAIEQMVAQGSEIDEIRELIERLIAKVQEEAFIQKAIQRTRQMHFKTLNETKDRTPWAYESGGSVEDLISCYFRMVNLPKKFEMKPKNPHDLLCHLLEWIKDAPYRFTNRFDADPMQGMLMTSPVHAFLFKPGLQQFRKAWSSNTNTYTYVRDQIEGKFQQTYYQNPLTFEELSQITQLFGPFGMPRLHHFDEMRHWAEKKPPQIQTLFSEIVINLFKTKSIEIDLPFGDTNWESDLFTFVMNPIYGKLELWRKNGNLFRALPSWQDHFQEKKWNLFTEQFLGQ